MKVHVVTVATDNKGYLDILKESCQRYGLELTILGFGEKWGGFTWKMFKTREYIQSNASDDDIVIFVDGYDTIFLAEQNYIIEKFLSCDTNILISVDTPPPNYFVLLMYSKVFETCGEININSGMYMGYVGYMKQFLDILCKDEKCLDSTSDDQRLVIELCRSDNVFFKNNVKLDVDNKVFYNAPILCKKSQLFNNNDVHLENNSLMSKKTNSKISVISGPGNTDLSKIIEMYGFKSPYQRRSVSAEYINRVKIYHKYFKKEIYISCAILIVIIFFVFRKK